VLDVAAAATTIAFGAGLSGEGELLVSQLTFQEVGDEVPVTAGPHRPRQPQNLDFSQAYGWLAGCPPGVALPDRPPDPNPMASDLQREQVRLEY
jgi:hypothetical protein